MSLVASTAPGTICMATDTAIDKNLELSELLQAELATMRYYNLLCYYNEALLQVSLRTSGEKLSYFNERGKRLSLQKDLDRRAEIID